MVDNGDEQARVAAIEQTVAVPEILRTRARSFASLVATAAGALSAAIVFSPFSEIFWGGYLVLAFISIVLLVVSLGFLVSASIYFSASADGTSKSERFKRWWNGGRSAKRPVFGAITFEGLQSSSAELAASITLRTRLGSLVAATAVSVFLLSLALALPNPQTRSVLIVLDDSHLSLACDDLPSRFTAEVLEKDLRLATEFIRVTVAAETCNRGTSGRVDIFIPTSIVVANDS